MNKTSKAMIATGAGALGILGIDAATVPAQAVVVGNPLPTQTARVTDINGLWNSAVPIPVPVNRTPAHPHRDGLSTNIPAGTAVHTELIAKTTSGQEVGVRSLRSVVLQNRASFTPFGGWGSSPHLKAQQVYELTIVTISAHASQTVTIPVRG